LPFFDYTERLNIRFPFGFFILLDLNVFSVSLIQQIEDPLFLSLSLSHLLIITTTMFSNISHFV
ncbi:unnamed protein product, partial [marine sediment metagenome]